ncbi:hypothetical protein BKA66DRAFT_564146 [Pyrenochaeta sp. MPI-SDFR-AT-0127]|nr:hypothetical protein BKA66DRAFT_564146 [Pyrenochaeta sp. MPI-SDFR-AT-0127]
MNAPAIVAAHLGFGRDIWSIPPDNITTSFKWLYVAYCMYMVAEALCQLSILSFYLRIIVDPKLRLAVWVLVGLIICFGLGNTFVMIFNCMPIPLFWDGWRGEISGSCVDLHLFSFIRGGIEIFLDLAILSLPLPMPAKLQMSKKKKLQVMSMFCVGFVITVVSCLRLLALVQFARTQNPTHDNTSGIYWSATEANLFIVVACMPALRGILHKAFRRFRDGSSYASKGQYGSDGPGKGSYLGHNSDRHQKFGSLTFGVISKSTDVNIYRTERSDSDIELVNGPPSV